MKSILISLALCLLLTGCVTAKMEFPDGRQLRYTRFMADQQLTGVIVEADGSVLIESQKSDMAGVYGVMNKLIDRIP